MMDHAQAGYLFLHFRQYQGGMVLAAVIHHNNFEIICDGAGRDLGSQHHAGYGTAIIEVAQLGFNELTLGSRQMQALGRSPVAIYPDFLADACRQLLAQWARMPGRQVY